MLIFYDTDLVMECELYIRDARQRRDAREQRFANYPFAQTQSLLNMHYIRRNKFRKPVSVGLSHCLYTTKMHNVEETIFDSYAGDL